MARTRVLVRLLLPRAEEAVALGLSAGAHVVLVLILAGIGARSAALGTPAPLRPVIAVDLAASRAPARPAPARPVPRPEPVQPEPEPEPERRVPTRRHADAPPPERGPAPDTTAQTRTLPEPEPVAPTPAPEAGEADAGASPDDGAAAALPAVPGSEGGIAGSLTEDPSFRADWYVNLVHMRLVDAWRDRPVLPAGRDTMRAVVSFRIMRDGAVRDVRLAIPSGFAPLDESARRAVESLGTLPALPRGYEKESVPARFVFELVPGSR